MTKYGHLVATVANTRSAQWLLNHQEEIARESNWPIEIMSEEMVPMRTLTREPSLAIPLPDPPRTFSRPWRGSAPVPGNSSE